MDHPVCIRENLLVYVPVERRGAGHALLLLLLLPAVAVLGGLRRERHCALLP